LPSLTWSQSTMAARMAASGWRAYQMWRVEMCPWRMDFSRADWAEMALRGGRVRPNGESCYLLLNAEIVGKSEFPMVMLLPV
jgi:hypothetical protein